MSEKSAVVSIKENSAAEPGGQGNEMKTWGERALLAAAKRGQTTAFGVLCEPYEKRLFHRMLQITRNREDAEDALQDAFLGAFVHIKSFDGRSSFSTWLTRIAINAALMKLRKNRASREIPMEGPMDPNEGWFRFEPADCQLDPEQLYAQQEQKLIVARAVSGLRPAIRKAVEIRQLQELSMKETAQTLGISVAAAKGRLFHGRVALRKSFRFRAMGSDRICRAA